MKRRSLVLALVGLFCLPTSSKFHMTEPKRSGAFKEGQDAFLLEATQSLDEGGYPQYVVLTADAGQLDLSVGDEPKTQHAEVRKNLPPRKVTGILRADGSIEGVLPPKGVGIPHWSFIPANPEGGASIVAIDEAKKHLANNRAAAESEKEAAREAKKATKKPSAASASAST